MSEVPTLKRALGPIQAYSAMIGILVGAGIFKLNDAFVYTGPSIVLGYIVLAPVILAAALPYAAFHSTSLASGSGGDYAHIRAVFGRGALACLAGWLKLISYLGALVYLAIALAEYSIELFGMAKGGEHVGATLYLIAFYVIHSLGVTWFGRIQVVMCSLLGLSILILVVFGLFAVETSNYRPFFEGDAEGFVKALPILFFAYAGFESIAHNAAEVRDSRATLPRVYMRGIALTALIFVSMSAVVVGVLGEAANATEVPMATAAQKYLSSGATIVAFGGVMAIATSINATMGVPARLAITLSEDGYLPRLLAALHPRSRVPVRGLLASLVVALLLLWSGQHGLALNIAVLALLCVYALHSAAFLQLRRRNPELADQVSLTMPIATQNAISWLGLGMLLTLIGTTVVGDVSLILAPPDGDKTRAWTSTELILGWSILGWVLMWCSKRTRGQGE